MADFKKEVPRLSEFIIRTAIKYHRPVRLSMKSGKEFVGVMKGVDLKNSSDITLYRADDTNKVYASLSYDCIEGIELLDSVPADDGTPVPF